jgi:hypothetical protein
MGERPPSSRPPGLDCDDSYFARTLAHREAGRLYVGYLAPARDRQHCLAPLAAALLAAPRYCSAMRVPTARPCWMPGGHCLVYHGSLKGVGISRNALQDIESFMARYQREDVERRHAGSLGQRQPVGGDGRRLAATPATSRAPRPAHEPHVRGRERPDLRPAAAAAGGDPEALDLALATNMVSVGLDVARLAAMVINGQPLTTAEYIQASSRVGRADMPGIVIANYYRDQARSLSHYESFRAYHESFYRFVEPTSVTPFTYQARLRALHAALVIAVRHADGRLTANERAADFDPS